MASHNSSRSKPPLPTSLPSPSIPSSSLKSLLLFATLVTFLIPVAAVQCTYPNYATTVQPGQSTVLAWQASSGDMATYDTITATLYCMDLNGPRGGMWRTASTLFSNRGLLSTSDQFRFSVPDCGQLVRNVAVRIVATSKSSNRVVTSQPNDSCYFMMNRAAVVPPVEPPVKSPVEPPVEPPATTTTPPVVRPPVVTTNPPVPTVAPPVTNDPPPVSPDPTKTTTIPPGVPTSTRTTGGIPGLTPSNSGDDPIAPAGGYPTGKIPHPDWFPPLPPIPGSPEDVGEPSKEDKNKNLATLLGSVCGGAALVIMVSLLVLRRRQKRRRPCMASLEDIGFDGYEKKPTGIKRILGLSKSDSNKGHFFRMDDDSSPCDDDMDGASTTKPRVLVTEAEAEPYSIAPPPLPALMVTTPTPSNSARISAALAMTPDTFELDARLATPSPVMLHDSLASRRRSSFSLFDLQVPPSPAFSSGSYPRASSSFGSMCSSGSSFEDESSVVQRYWEAAQRARAERQAELNGSTYGDHLPQNRMYSFLSQSSDSRKADILTLGTTTDEDEAIAQAHNEFFFAGGPRKNTLNSMLNKYLGKSFRMSLSSLQTTDTGSTGFYDNSDVEDARLYGKKSKRVNTSHRGPGFRSTIDTDFLDHLHIKSLQKGDRQLEYYSHYYNRNPTISTISSQPGAIEEQFREDSMVLGTDESSTSECSPEVMSYRTSSVPSLTSTNDPFNTFDSDLTVVHTPSLPEEEMRSPFDDCHQQIDSGVVVVVGQEGERTNTVLLRSFPTPPDLDS